MATVTDSADLVDWDLALTLGARMVRPGPSMAAAQARGVVAELRDCAVEARGHVRAFTGLDAPVAEGPVAVVDRGAWVRSNVAGLRHLLDAVAVRLHQRRPPAALRAVGSRATAVEIAVALGWLSGKVLGQYELFPPGGPDGDHPGRLLLVAPNVVDVERQLGLSPQDFRLWVCLHEETHRVQFTAVPWLRAHLLGEIDQLVDAADPSPAALVGRLGDVAAAVGAALAGRPGVSLAEALQTPEQRAVLDRLTTFMSLLEGHADVVMDGVGPAVVPSVATIRERFQRRREHPGRAEAAVRRLVGLDAKLAQYKAGAAFVRGVVDRVGMAGFNRVWESARTLPTPAELADPQAWVARVPAGPADPGGVGPSP